MWLMVSRRSKHYNLPLAVLSWKRGSHLIQSVSNVLYIDHANAFVAIVNNFGKECEYFPSDPDTTLFKMSDDEASAKVYFAGLIWEYKLKSANFVYNGDAEKERREAMMRFNFEHLLDKELQFFKKIVNCFNLFTGKWRICDLLMSLYRIDFTFEIKILYTVEQVERLQSTSLLKKRVRIPK